MKSYQIIRNFSGKAMDSSAHVSKIKKQTYFYKKISQFYNNFSVHK
jgi:hypothetical protein